MKKTKYVENFLNWQLCKHLVYGDLYLLWWAQHGQDLFLDWAKKKHKTEYVKLKDLEPLMKVNPASHI